MEIFGNARMAELHPTGHHPETPARLVALHAHLPGIVECGPATEEAILRCHTAAHVEHIRGIHSEIWLDGDTPGSPSTWEAALLSAGASAPPPPLWALSPNLPSSTPTTVTRGDPARRLLPPRSETHRPRAPGG